MLTQRRRDWAVSRSLEHATRPSLEEAWQARVQRNLEKQPSRKEGVYLELVQRSFLARIPPRGRVELPRSQCVRSALLRAGRCDLVTTAAGQLAS